jgi:hypothetical protein
MRVVEPHSLSVALGGVPAMNIDEQRDAFADIEGD